MTITVAITSGGYPIQFELFAGRYQLQEPTGRDGMATIYRGRDLRTNPVVAIKVLRDIYSTDLRRYLRGRGILDIDTAVSIAHDVALGLGAAHRRGVVHRSVKPQNILMGRDGSIKLTNFGISFVMDAERLTDTGTILGAVQYYAPEQAQGEIVSPAADVYGLSV